MTARLTGAAGTLAATLERRALLEATRESLETLRETRSAERAADAQFTAQARRQIEKARAQLAKPFHRPATFTD